MSSPCHIELPLSDKEEPVKKDVTFDSFAIACEFVGTLVPSFGGLCRSEIANYATYSFVAFNCQFCCIMHLKCSTYHLLPKQ